MVYVYRLKKDSKTNYVKLLGKGILSDSSLLSTTCSGIFLSAVSSNPTLFVRKPASLRKSGAPSGRRLWRGTTCPELVSSWPAGGNSIWICEPESRPVVLALRSRLTSPRWSWTHSRTHKAGGPTTSAQRAWWSARARKLNHCTTKQANGRVYA